MWEALSVLSCLWVTYLLKISYIVENILLGDSCVFSEPFVIKLTAEMLVYGSAHPYVNGKSIEIIKSEKRGT